jgi:hypothetical protein
MNIFLLSFKVEAQNFLEKLLASALETFEFFLNEKKLQIPKLSFSIQEGMGLHIGLFLQESYSRGSKLGLKINLSEWMIKNTNRVLKIFEFSIKLSNDYQFCGNSRYFHESKLLR